MLQKQATFFRNSWKKTVLLLGGIFAFVSVLGIFHPAPALALVGEIGIGGKFLPGLYDIFTPAPPCGVFVSVVTPRGTVVTLNFMPFMIYDEFYKTPNHIGTNMVGSMGPAVVCAPVLNYFGSSLQ